MHKFLFVTLFFFSLNFVGFAQLNNVPNAPNRPYSRYGIGELYDNNLASGFASGGIGVSYLSGSKTSIINPALGATNSLTSYTINFAGYQSNIYNNENEIKQYSFQLNNLSITFPIHKIVNVSAGVRPYSLMNYIDKEDKLVVNDSLSTSQIYSGNGGVSQVYFQTAINIYKGLNVGFFVARNFGSVTHRSYSMLRDENNFLNGTESEENNSADLKGFQYKIGVSYHDSISSSLMYNIGATYQPNANLRAENSRILAYELDNRWYISDEIISDYKIQLPSEFRIGFSIRKVQKWMFGVDIQQSNWSEFKIDNKEVENFSKNTTSVMMGGEFIPNYNSVSGPFRGFWSRATYRFGFAYQTLPVQVNNKSMSEFGISAGLGLPINKFGTNMALGVMYGKSNGTDSQMIKEDFIRFSLGFTLADKWFTKRKID